VIISELGKQDEMRGIVLMKNQVDPKVAEEIFDLLVSYGLKDGDYERERFVRELACYSQNDKEYLVRGIIGSGGKIRVNSCGEVFLTMYREHETPELLAKQLKINQELSRFNVK
jgi:hypothetical protein